MRREPAEARATQSPSSFYIGSWRKVGVRCGDGTRPDADGGYPDLETTLVLDERTYRVTFDAVPANGTACPPTSTEGSAVPVHEGANAWTLRLSETDEVRCTYRGGFLRPPHGNGGPWDTIVYARAGERLVETVRERFYCAGSPLVTTFERVSGS